MAATGAEARHTSARAECGDQRRPVERSSSCRLAVEREEDLRYKMRMRMEMEMELLARCYAMQRGRTICSVLRRGRPVAEA